MIHNDFIKENISAINKNKTMVIEVGTSIDDYIFINKHTRQTINQILFLQYDFLLLEVR